ncbi:MAG: hypothetical protein EXS14_01500 [Planctomycetes bacterium]|nr:hypothetical protein [Planctomycetota bacterium]
MSGANGAAIRTIITTGYENLFGRAVCGLGDWDNDGKGDFAVGTPNEDVPGLLNCGRALLYGGGVRDTSTLELFGTMSVANPNSPYIRVLGTPGLPPVVFADPIPGPTPIPPFGFAGIGFSPWMLSLNNPIGLLGPIFGSNMDSQGLLQIGPFGLPSSAIGLSIFVQSFHPTALAPNGAFQRTNTLMLTVTP